jgi:hypothetical protein
MREVGTLGSQVTRRLRPIADDTPPLAPVRGDGIFVQKNT